jgi:PAS domain S-box-containing protein
VKLLARILDSLHNHLITGVRTVTSDVAFIPHSRYGSATELAAHLAAIVESSDNAIVSTDPQWIVESWNPAAERLFGYTADEMIGRSILDLVPFDQQSEAVRVVEEVRADGHVAPYETVRVRKDGSLVAVSVNPWPVRTPAGEFISLAAIYADLTERRRLEGQLRQAAKIEAVGRLAGGIAHDFNNLLTVIAGYGALAQEALPLGDPVRELIGEMIAAGERAAGLTRQLLAFSRKQVLAPVVLDLNQVVREMEKLLARLIGADIDFAIHLQPGPVLVRADAGQIEQVIMNLVVNARDAMPTGGKLSIETHDVELDDHYALTHPGVKPGQYVQLAVIDSGIGMTAEIRAQVFEPFFTTKGPGKGTGLGLATVFGIVQQSGGSVEVYSEPGVGTAFKVYLPRCAEPGLQTCVESIRPVARGTETILLVEDEASVRTLSGFILREAGYTVLEAQHGHHAVQVAGEFPGSIHLLATDVVMPGLGGRDLAALLVTMRPHLRVLYMSGYTDDAVVHHGILQGEANFLQKPFTPAGLTRAVRDALDAAAK